MTTYVGNGDLATVTTSTHVQQMVTALRASKEHRISPQVLANSPATVRQDRPNRFSMLWNVYGKEA